MSETAVCFLHIQEIETNVCFSKYTQSSTEVGLESCKILVTKCVLEQPMFAVLSVVTHIKELSEKFRVVDITCQSRHLLPQTLFHGVTDLVCMIYCPGLPILAK